MVETRGKTAVIVLSSDDSDCDDSNFEDSDYEDGDCEDSSFEDSDYEDGDCEDSNLKDSDRDEASESDHSSHVDDSSLSDKVIALLRERNDIDSLKLNECKAYLRIHRLRIAGNRDVCVSRIKEHWRLKHESGYTMYPRSSFDINCTGDVCMGDVILFRQKVYEKFDKVTRHGKVLGNRTVAGRVVKESYGAAKQQHTFTVEVLWSCGARPLPALFPLLVKGRNLYKQKTYRQRWKNEADRIKVLNEKHKRGAAARSTRALNQKKRSHYKNESKGSRRKQESHNKKGSKVERPRVVHQDNSRKAYNFQPRGATSSTQATQKENASLRAARYTWGRHNTAEFDRYQVPVYPSYNSYPQNTCQYQVNSHSRNEPSEFFYHNRSQIPNMTGFLPSRIPVGEFASRSQHGVSNGSHHHAHTNPYDFEMKNYGWR